MNRPILRISLVLTVIMMLCFYFGESRIDILSLYELKALDARFRLRGGKNPGNDVVIVAVDDTSLEKLGRWPFSRSIHGRLLDTLTEAGAGAVGFDILFTEQEESLELIRLRQLRQYFESLPIARSATEGAEFAQLMGQVIEEADHDRKFADAIARNHMTVMPIVFRSESRSVRKPDSEKTDTETSETMNRPGSNADAGKSEPPDDEPPADLLELMENDASGVGDASLPPKIKAAAFDYRVPEKENQFDPYKAAAVMLPLRRYYENAESVGAVNFSLDIDGNVRWADQIINYYGQYFRTFNFQIARLYRNYEDKDIRILEGRGIQFGETFIPLDMKGRLLLNLYGPPMTFKYIPYVQVIDGAFERETFKDKIVLVGFAATGLFDAYTTSYVKDGAMPGVEMHATAIANILNDDFMVRNRNIRRIDMLVIFIIGLLLSILIPRCSSLKAAVCAFMILLLTLAANYIGFSIFNIWLNIVYPVLTILVLATSTILFKFFTEEKDKRFLKATFESYLSPDVINAMVENKVMPKLGGEARFITAFFTDIEGFTSISEKLTAEQLVELLNQYLSSMTDILISEKGTLDKYEGDAIIAFFGAPQIMEDHAIRACRTALRMQAKLTELSRYWAQAKTAPEEPERNVNQLPEDEWGQGDMWPIAVTKMKMRIGINTGRMVVGNMGSSMRMDYTIMGDDVNLAARLENACKHYGVYILISEKTLMIRLPDDCGNRKTVANFVDVRFMDNVAVAGRKKPVKIYELLGMKGELGVMDQALLETFSTAMNLYLNMQWDEAAAKFRAAAKIERFKDASVNPSLVFLERCRYFKQHPPTVKGEGWDGVFRLTKK